MVVTVALTSREALGDVLLRLASLLRQRLRRADRGRHGACNRLRYSVIDWDIFWNWVVTKHGSRHLSDF